MTSSGSVLPVLLLVLLLVLVISYLGLFGNRLTYLTDVTNKQMTVGATTTMLVGSPSYDEMLFERAAYERDIVNCSVTVFNGNQEKEFEEYMNSTNKEMRRCSVTEFRNYFKKNDRFFGDGAWMVKQIVFPTKLEGDFYPEGCLFDRDITDNVTTLSKCMEKHRLTKILITGDSNGNRYREELQYFLCNRSKSCELDSRGKQNYRGCSGKKEDWSEYYRVPNKPLVCSQLGCPHCLAHTLHGKGFGPDQINFTIEFIGIVAFIRPGMMLEDEEDSSRYILDVPVLLEYILRDYLPYYGFPDIWFISPPTHHESWFQTVEQYKENVTLFRRLLDHYLPSTTKVMLFTDIRECPMYRVDLIQEFHHAFNTTRERNEVFNAMNQVIFDTFRDRLLEENGQYLGFLDTGRILCPFTCSWHYDGGHMKNFVYARFWEYIFDYICSK